MSDRKKIAKPLKMKMAKYTPRYWFDTHPYSSAAHHDSQ